MTSLRHFHNPPSFRCPWPITITILTLAQLWAVHSASAQDTLRWTTNYYAVTGATLPEIHQSLTRSRPWKDGSNLDGLTEWRVDWRFTVASSGGECRCVSFTTRTTITVTLPRWTPPTNATANVKETWTRYLTALGQHEAGHAQIALAAVAAQHKRIKELDALPDCDGLKQKIDGLARTIVDEFREQDAAYDRRTEHGLKQGAFLPGREGRRDRGRP